MLKDSLPLFMDDELDVATPEEGEEARALPHILNMIFQEMQTLRREPKTSDVQTRSFLRLGKKESIPTIIFHDLSFFVASALSLSLQDIIRESGATIHWVGNYNHFGDPCSPGYQSLMTGTNSFTAGTSHAWLWLTLPSGRRIVATFALECTTRPFEDSRFIRIHFKEEEGARKDITNWIAHIRQLALKKTYCRGRVIELIDTEQPPRFLKFEAVTDEDIILSAQQREKIEQDFLGALQHGEALKALGARSQRGLVLEGPPGTGKTMTGRWIWQRIQPLGFSMIVIAPTCLSHVGSYFIQSLFNMAKDLEPCLVWFEDIDLIGKQRGHAASSFMLGELLTALDGLEDRGRVYVAATTNEGNQLDDALRFRPGRFDVRVEYPYPDKEARRQMLMRFGKSLIESGKVPELPVLVVEETEGFSGAYLRELVDRVALASIMQGHDLQNVWLDALSRLKQDMKNSPRPVGFEARA